MCSEDWMKTLGGRAVSGTVQKRTSPAVKNGTRFPLLDTVSVKYFSLDRSTRGCCLFLAHFGTQFRSAPVQQFRTELRLRQQFAKRRIVHQLAKRFRCHQHDERPIL